MSYDSLDCRAVAQTLWGMLFWFFFMAVFFLREKYRSECLSFKACLLLMFTGKRIGVWMYNLFFLFLLTDCKVFGKPL